MLAALGAWAQNSTDTIKSRELEELTVTTRRPGMSRVAGAENGMRINRAELFKAACCNLGESFTTNPSVDVNYSDAATGAKQIRLYPFTIPNSLSNTSTTGARQFVVHEAALIIFSSPVKIS